MAQGFLPLPNQAGVNNLASAAVSPNDFDSFIGKVDQRITEKDSVAFRIINRQNFSGSPYSIPDAAGSNNTGVFGSSSNVHILLAGLTYTRLFAPTLINELRVAFSVPAQPDQRRILRHRLHFSSSDCRSVVPIPV